MLLPAIRQGLKDSNPFVRREAARATSAFGAAAKEALPELILLIKNYPMQDSGWFAAEALGEIGPDAREAIPELVRAAEVRGSMMADSAKKALKKIKIKSDKEMD